MTAAVIFSFGDVARWPRAGRSVGGAPIAIGKRWPRTDECGNPRGGVCGIGLRWQCRGVISDVPDTRACMTTVPTGMVVRPQHGLRP